MLLQVLESYMSTWTVRAAMFNMCLPVPQSFSPLGSRATTPIHSAAAAFGQGSSDQHDPQNAHHPYEAPTRHPDSPRHALLEAVKGPLAARDDGLFHDSSAALKPPGTNHDKNLACADSCASKASECIAGGLLHQLSSGPHHDSHNCKALEMGSSSHCWG
jgi:hypothetical protein